MDHPRRDFIKTSAKVLLMAPVVSLAPGSRHYEGSPGNPPSGFSGPGLPKLSLNVRDFGARGDGQSKDTVPIQQAIDRCSVLGGGTIVVPPGNYLTGAIALRSHTRLMLHKDALLTGSPDLNDYPVTQVRWEGKWIQGYSALLYAIDERDIGILGEGKIAGHHALGGRPSASDPLRRPALIETIGCTQVKLEGFSTDYHLMWSIHPTCSDNIIIRNLTIRSTGGNGDGIDIDSCKHVLIEGCDISTGDDCIAIKSGRGMEGYTLASTTEDVLISHCTFRDSIFACIGIGSETSGGIRQVRIEHCKFLQARTYALYIKTRVGRGAFIRDIRATDLEVSGMQGGFLRLNLLNSGIQDPDPVPGEAGIPLTRDFAISNVRVTDVPVLVDGSTIHPDKKLVGFSLKNIQGSCKKGITLANMEQVHLGDIRVTGFSGPLVTVSEVTGSGLHGAFETHIPLKVPASKPPGNPPYHLH